MPTPRCPICRGEKKLFTRRVENCARCDASGTYHPPCRRCNGERFIDVQHGYKATCHACNGAGRNMAVSLKCRRCAGRGQQIRTRTKRCKDCRGTGQLLLNPVLPAEFTLPAAA